MGDLEARAHQALKSFVDCDLDLDYRLGAPVAEGGMAAIHKGFGGCGRQVAIKIPHTVAAKAVLRFERERQALSLFSDDSICRLIAHGMIARKPALVLEWIAGQSLQNIVETMLTSAFDRREKLLLVRLLLQKIAASVELVHNTGLVHRDLTPANFLLTRLGVAKLIDFGVVAPLPELVSENGLSGKVKFNLTQDQVPGTPLYMAPELFQLAAPEPLADIYSLGSVLYFMVTGKPPHADAPHEMALLYRKTSLESLPDPRRNSDFCPAWLRNVICKAGATDPRQRYQSVAKLREDLAIEHEKTSNVLLERLLEQQVVAA